MTDHKSTERNNFIRHSFLNAVVNGSHMTQSQRRKAYILLSLFLIIVLWTPAVLITTISKPSYTSKWTLILPGTGAGHAVSLDSIGQASATISSSYSGTSLDPKVNYKAIASSEPVLMSAANKLNLSLDEFGEPKIKLVDQSTLMYFSISADTAELAHNKSIALYESLQEQLNWLRNDESQSRENAIRTMLSSFSNKLTDAQKNILDFQTDSSIVSIDQFKELTLTIERMRSQRASLVAELSGLNNRVNSLGDTLGLEPSLAADAMSLQQDRVFQRHLQSFAESSSLLTEYNAKWGSNHPKVINATEKNNKYRVELLNRSRHLLRKSLKVEQLLTLGINDNRSGLFQQLVTLHTQLIGMQAEQEMLDQQMHELQVRLENNTNDAASLEDLNRKQQVATAVFTTALAKLDIGKSDAFASYPLIQMLAQPTLPDTPDRLKAILALGGAAAGTIFSLIALGLLWIRKPYLRKILMNE